VPNWCGSFGLSVLGARGVSISSVIAPWASFLNYGPIGPDGVAEVHLSFDHRVMDGAAGAEAIRALERMLHGPLLAELRAMAPRAAA
jgi:pyruvate/2-oxoglutarate dehydrogenase complex dihydrolipoamide acyltransferase (E2) component